MLELHARLIELHVHVRHEVHGMKIWCDDTLEKERDRAPCVDVQYTQQHCVKY